MKIQVGWDKIERTIGGMKFAVVVIVIFTITMIIGTFFESYFGTDFANRTIYKSPFFMILQLLIFLSIIFAAFLRLPPQKRLYGFYTIHSGLVIIGIGSLITYLAGIDGHLTLPPNQPAREVVLSRDIFKITYPDEGRVLTTFLPYTAFEVPMEQKYNNITIKKYLPFAEGKLSWIDSNIYSFTEKDHIQSTQYHYKNAFAEQDITLSLHPEASNEFQSTSTMGPLSFIYLPEMVWDCFKNIGPSKVIFLNSKTAECFHPPLAHKGNTHNILYKGQKLNFIPMNSPFPFDQNNKPDTKSELRVLFLGNYEANPTLFLFGNKASFYSKADKLWQHLQFKGINSSINLPWMGAEIKLVHHEINKLPFNVPTTTIPIQKNGRLIKGDMKAVQLEILGKNFWVSNTAPLAINIQGKNIVFEVTKETLNLPFEMALTNFKMDTSPGTNMPASYESFVKLFQNSGMTNHHIYMNNPLKVEGFTLYQSSYAQDEKGKFSSTLTVNVDQGRPLKYLGSLMLVLGAIWHFNINKKKKN